MTHVTARAGVSISTPYREASVTRLADALASAGLLDRFYVALDTGRATAVARRAGAVGAAPARVLAKRCYPVAATSVAPLHDVFVTLAYRRDLRRHDLLARRGAAVDAAVARRLRRGDGHPSAVVGMPYASLETFRAAHSLGAAAVFNHVNANWRTENAVFEREAERASTHAERDEILRERWPEALVARVDDEVDLAEVVLVPSRYVRDDLTARGVDPERVAVVPYGVDVRAFAPTARDARARPLRVLYVGQVGYRKGLRYLARAARLIPRAVESVTVVGPIVNGTRVLARELPDAAYVPTIPRHELARRYAAADVFVLPSLADSFALVALEAMAAGLPVIVTPATGASELIDDGVHGFVVPAGDELAIAARIEALARDGDLRSSMGSAARKRAEEYPWSRYEDHAVETIGRLLRHASHETAVAPRATEAVPA